MREILFRGKRLDTGEWVEGFYATNPEWDRRLYGEHHWIISCKNAFQYEIDPATVGQYTGLTDMRGVKIFEGDVVTMAEEYGKIEYSETEAMFQVVFDTWCTDFDHYFGTDFEVVGNIHDNPELLK